MSTYLPRILYVSAVSPGKETFGGELRSTHVLRALQQMATVEVVVLDDGGNRFDEPPMPDSEFNIADRLSVKLKAKNGIVAKIRWTFDPRSDYPHGCGVGPDEMQSVLGRINEFDLIWFFKSRSADMFPTASWRNSVVDIDDVPSTYEKSLLEGSRNPSEYVSALRRLFTWRRREKLLGERFSVLAVCSEEDKQYLKRMGLAVPIHVIPNGFDRPASEPIRKPSLTPRIGFIGLFDYLPNREGVKWFVDNCWGHIKRDIPAARLRLVGSATNGVLKPLGRDIDGLGWVADPSHEMATWSAMIVPLRVGAGTRIKIAEGFSRKCPIVSTALGAYGYGAVNDREICLADSAEDFARACIRLIREPEQATQMADRAWHQFLEKWTWDAIRPQIWAAAEDCLRRRADGTGSPILCPQR